MSNLKEGQSVEVKAGNASSWDWILPAVVAALLGKFLGLLGGLIAFGGYYWLKPKIGALGAVAASVGLGFVVTIIVRVIVGAPA